MAPASDSLQDELGLHIAVILQIPYESAIDTLINNLVEWVKQEKRVQKTRNGENEKKRGKTVQSDGMAGTLPEKILVERIVCSENSLDR